MAYKLSGTVLLITPTQTLPTKSGNTYQKRDLVITARKFDEYTGRPTEDAGNTPKFTFFGKQCEQLDGLKAGDLVKVGFDIAGRSYAKDGRIEYFTEVRPKYVDFNKQGNQPSAPQPRQACAPAGYPQQEAMAQHAPCEEPEAERREDELPF